ncbi:peptidase U32 family protein [Paenibacillus sp. y28]|uniref:peptidase U32 family protein n=1 Tax=Paenibacillus sp. y28 TaxID=3129110 RepID=UPI0030183618
MASKTELLIPAGSLDEVKRYVEAGADSVMVGEGRFGLRLPGSMSPAHIAEAAAYMHGRGGKLYVSVNTIFENDDLDALPGYVKAMQEAGVDALVFGDPAVLIAMKQAGVELPLHWNTEMTSTNYVTANYWGKKGATRAFLARELNMEQVIEMKGAVHMEIQVQVHGMTNIYHSRRNLVHNYLRHQNEFIDGTELASLGADRGFRLMEAERPDLRFPVFEDESGTHIMSADDICMLENIHELMEAGVDCFKIEGLLKSPEYNETVLRSYRQAIDSYWSNPAGYEFQEEWLEAIQEVQEPERELSYGFFYKEQVY